MATNPKIPPEQYRPDDHAHVVLTRKRGSFWPPFVVVIGIVVLVALIVWLVVNKPHHRTLSALTQEVSGVQVSLTNLAPTTPTRSGEMDVTGKLVNRSNQSITGVVVEAVFQNINGQELKRAKEQLRPAGNPAQMGFENSPIAPGATQAIDIRFAKVPESWNGQVPKLHITQVQTTQNP